MGKVIMSVMLSLFFSAKAVALTNVAEGRINFSGVLECDNSDEFSITPFSFSSMRDPQLASNLVTINYSSTKGFVQRVSDGYFYIFPEAFLYARQYEENASYIVYSKGKKTCIDPYYETVFRYSDTGDAKLNRIFGGYICRSQVAGRAHYLNIDYMLEFNEGKRKYVNVPGVVSTILDKNSFVSDFNFNNGVYFINPRVGIPRISLNVLNDELRSISIKGDIFQCIPSDPNSLLKFFGINPLRSAGAAESGSNLAK